MLQQCSFSFQFPAKLNEVDEMRRLETYGSPELRIIGIMEKKMEATI